MVLHARVCGRVGSRPIKTSPGPRKRVPGLLIYYSMRALQFWKAVVEDKVDFLEDLIESLERLGIRYCVIGGQAVNAYVDPLVSLDLDLVIAVDQISAVQSRFADRFKVEEFPHSLNISAPGSSLRVQIQKDPRYFPFVERSSPREVLGLVLPVARLEDVLDGKVWAATDKNGRPSKRRKDLLDIGRLIESHPRLRNRVPADVLVQLG